MDTAKITMASTLKSTAAGWSIFSKLLLPSSTPMRRMRAETTSPEIYSMRPWPKGCSGSGFFPARRKPRRVTSEEPASERLLKASAVTAMEPERVPAKNLPKKSSRFQPMPTAPHREP